MRRIVVLMAALAVAVMPLIVMSPAEAAPYTVSISASKSTIVAGDGGDGGVVISGTINPHTPDKAVHIQGYFGGKWKDVFTSTTKTNGVGHYEKLVNPTSPGVRKYRAYTAGMGSSQLGTSRTVTVTVYAWLDLAELQTTSNVSDMYFDGGGSFGLVQDSIASGDDAWVNNDATDGSGYGKTSWNLKNQCTRIRGRAGLDDTSSVGADGHLIIRFDGAGYYSEHFFGGDAELVSIPINRTAYLTIESHREVFGEYTIVGFGEPEILCKSYLPAS